MVSPMCGSFHVSSKWKRVKMAVHNLSRYYGNAAFIRTPGSVSSLNLFLSAPAFLPGAYILTKSFKRKCVAAR